MKLPKQAPLLLFTVLVAGCGAPPVVTNPEVKPTKAVLGNPSSLMFKGKPASGGQAIAPGGGKPTPP